MAQVQRNDIEQTGDAFAGYAPASRGYEAGGPVGQLQADLAVQLGAGIGWAPALDRSPAERWVHRASLAGGYAALAAGYAIAAMAVAHWA